MAHNTNELKMQAYIESLEEERHVLMEHINTIAGDIGDLMLRIEALEAVLHPIT